MLNDALAFWNAIRPKVDERIRELTQNVVRRERFSVSTPPDGTKIGVKQPFGKTEIFVPYTEKVQSAQIGDTVLVEWRGTLSTALAVTFGDGR